MQIFVAGILGLVGVILVVTGLNGSFWELWGSVTHSASDPGTRVSTGGTFLRSQAVGSVVGSSGAATTIKHAGLGTAGGRLGGPIS